jgi:hypothetical protein
MLWPWTDRIREQLDLELAAGRSAVRTSTERLNEEVEAGRRASTTNIRRDLEQKAGKETSRRLS